MKISSKFIVFGALVSAASALHAQTTWNGSGTDNNWSTPENWSTAVVPVSTGTVVFGDLDKTTSGTPNSTVAVSSTIRSLTFNNTGSTASDWQNLEIASGQTLTISNSTNTAAILVGGVSGTSTLAKITGSGALVIEGGTTSDFLVRGGGAGPYARPTLDMSGLSSFSGTFDLFAAGDTGIGLATVTLAQTNNLTINQLTIGSNQKNTSTGAGGNSVVNLGASNTIYANTISVGQPSSRTGGALQFSAANSSLVIRARAGGSSRADLTVGGGGDGSQTLTNIVDFNGSTVDAMLGNFVVGANGGGGGTITSNFSMNAGTVDATSAVIGSRTGGSTNATVGNVNIAGGTLQAGAMTIASNAGTATNTTSGTLAISGSAAVQVGTSGSNANLVMGNVTGVVNLTANATVNITGGSLTVFGNIAEGTNAGTGAINSTLVLNGGALDVKGNNITVDTFTVQSGTLANLGEFNNGANLVKSGAGTVTLQGANEYSGSTVVNAGTLLLADNASLTFYIQGTGVNNAISGIGAVSLDGDFVFDLTAAAAVGTWNVVSLSASYGSTFTVQGFTETSAGVWESGGYTFTEATGVLTAVPEPSAAVLCALGVTGLLWRSRRNRK